MNIIFGRSPLDPRGLFLCAIVPRMFTHRFRLNLIEFWVSRGLKIMQFYVIRYLQVHVQFQKLGNFIIFLLFFSILI
jgi:hypothetical protein